MFCDKEDRPDLGIDYLDSGPFDKELADLYSYSEYKDFNIVFNEFSLFLEEKKIQAWTILSEECKIDLIQDLFGRLNSSDGTVRQKAMFCLMYLAQGCWGELGSCQLEAKREAVMNWLGGGSNKDKDCTTDFHYEATKANIILLYKQGLLGCLIQVLNLETNQSTKEDSNNSVTMLDTVDLRMVLNLLYTLMETLRTLRHSTNQNETTLYEEFRQELSAPMIDEELLLVKLFNLLVEGSNGQNEHLPLKKILLCAWKTLLITFGDFETLENLRIQYREEAGLTRHFEHTLQVLRERIPALKVPQPENQNHAGDQKQDMWELGESKPRRSILRPSLLKVQTIASNSYEDDYKPDPDTMEPKKITTLPWKPKIDERELNMYVKYLRLKYFGLDLESSDVDSLFGLPEPLQEGIKILKDNLYTPLSTVQLKQEERLNRYFMSATDSIRSESPVESFYAATWRELRQYVITLLKLMLAATPLSVEKDKYLNIDAEIDAKIVYGALNHMLAETIGSDIKRHKDIMVKAISSIVLLLLKHYKLSHILQFEYLGSCLMNGNCLPFIVKYFNQNLDSVLLCSKSPSEAELEYPQCVRARPGVPQGGGMGPGSDGSGGSQKNQIQTGAGTISSSLFPSSSSPSSPLYSSTNIITSINLLRILNKLVKNKQSRIMALIYFKSFAPLKALLRVRHNVLQFYALKLIKLQSRYQGRQWRKVNIKILGYVFLMVRHRFHDDWAYGNELESKQQLDTQGDEAALKRVVVRFNRRRYTNEYEPDFVPLDHSLVGAMGSEKSDVITSEFEKWWPQWLEQKVLNRDLGFEWDQLLRQDTVM
uniref:Striatin-interacting protein 1 n=1 Tax=Cacopsylla melanoneura TaxID=428564 RepID=A0A8D8LJJ7_9HEMI